MLSAITHTLALLGGDLIQLDNLALSAINPTSLWPAVHNRDGA
jgi:hypothetical protein